MRPLLQGSPRVAAAATVAAQNIRTRQTVEDDTNPPVILKLCLKKGLPMKCEYFLNRRGLSSPRQGLVKLYLATPQRGFQRAFLQAVTVPSPVPRCTMLGSNLTQHPTCIWSSSSGPSRRKQARGTRALDRVEERVMRGGCRKLAVERHRVRSSNLTKGRPMCLNDDHYLCGGMHEWPPPRV